MTIHIGSWGTPELGLTELLTQNRTSEGGSDIFPNQTQTNNDILPPPNNALPVPQPYTYTPSPSPNNVPTNTTAGGFPADMYVGWDPVAAQADWAAKQKAGQTGGTSGGVDPRIADAEKFFSQATTLLGQQENFLGQTRDTSQLGLENFTQSALEQALGQLSSAQGLAGQQKNETLQNQRSIESENLRNYKNLEQQAMSRYGQGNSAGGALTEVLGQTFLRTAGSLREKTAATFQKIFDFEAQSQKSYNAATTKLEQDKQLATRQINDKYQEGMLQVAALRNENEMAKTNLRIQVLTDNIQRARDLADYSTQLKDSYDMWYAQQKVAAQEGWNVANQLYQGAISQNLFGNQQIQQSGQELSSLGSNPTAAISSAAYYKPFNKDTSSDDLTKLSNPWLA